VEQLPESAKRSGDRSFRPAHQTRQYPSNSERGTGSLQGNGNLFPLDPLGATDGDYEAEKEA